MEEKYLPIGTVVLLKDAAKMIMINGHCVLANEMPGKIFDYRGCAYPEGILTSKGVALFNHSDIEKIVHLGYLNEESKMFNEKIKKIVENVS